MSKDDACVGQRLLQLLDSVMADSGTGEVQPFKAAQSFEMGQRGVADCGVVEVQHAQARLCP